MYNSLNMPRWRPDITDCDEIEKGLYLGNVTSATNEANLEKLKITHVLSAYHIPLTIPGDVKVLQINVADCDTENILTYFDKTNKFIQDGQSNGCCLVHCHAGVSRSASLVIAYLMNKYELSFNEAKSKVKNKRYLIYPNAGFTEQLQLYEAMGCTLNMSFGRYKIFYLQWLAAELERDQDFAKVKRFLGKVEQNPTGDVFKCKSCRILLFSEANLLPHERSKTMNWRFNYPKADSQFCPSSLHIEVLPWITEALEPGSLKGKIYCPRCKSKIGSFCWTGNPCLCAAAVVPSFKIATDKVDRLKKID